MQHHSLHDSLTGLPSRVLLLDRLGQAAARMKRRPDCRFGVLFLAIDPLDVASASLVHEAREKFLIAVSKRLTSCLRDTDTVARLGEDEFIILLNDLSRTSDVLTVADRILRCLETPIPFDGHQVLATASIGIVSSASHLDTAEKLLHNASAAMLRARLRGKPAYAVFDEAADAVRIDCPIELAASGARSAASQLAQDVEPSRERRVVNCVRDPEVSVRQ